MNRFLETITFRIAKLVFFFIVSGSLAVMAGPVSTRLAVTVDSHDVKGVDEKGNVKFRLPLHQSNGIRYFSAGVGIEERFASYPPLPLKLIFVAGSQSYLALVSVTIQNVQARTPALEIPKEHVTGPWLFIDLPPGTYTIVGRYDGLPDVRRRVTVGDGRTKEVVLRWPSF